MFSKLKSFKSSLHLRHFKHSSKDMKDGMPMAKKEMMMDDMSMSTAQKSDGVMSSDMSSDMSGKDMPMDMSSKDGAMTEGQSTMAMAKDQDGAMPMENAMSNGMNEAMGMKDDMMKKDDMAMETSAMKKDDMAMENGMMKKDEMAMASGMMKNDNMDMKNDMMKDNMGTDMAMDKSAAMSNDTVEKSEPQVAIFGAGCFWGTEYMFLKHYPPKENKGIINTSVGFIDGVKDVTDASGKTTKSGGSAEACRVVFDPSVISYAELVEFFYRFHDPTMLNHQGNDKGKKYRSAIFTSSDEQIQIARRVSAEVQAKHFDPKGQKIVTKIETAGSWHESPASDQQHLLKNPNGYHCYTHKLHW